MPPTITEPAGAPEICGAELFSDTLIENDARLALSAPSDTVITMFEYVPTSFTVGMPLIPPVDGLKLAQDGKLVTVNVSASPSGSLAMGVNE